ncbi:unnamed protein product [Gordionus sp. m RMFG-2023]
MQPILIENILIYYFPAPDHYNCPVIGCGKVFRCLESTAQRHSLLKHLRRDHHLEIETSNICSRCDAGIGAYPSKHRCSGPPEVARPPTTFLYACGRCSCSFLSTKGLRNHVRACNLSHRPDPILDSVASLEGMTHPILTPASPLDISIHHLNENPHLAWITNSASHNTNQHDVVTQ